MLTVSKTKYHIKMIFIVVFVQCLLLIIGNAAYAVPYLQLDAYPAVYVGGEEESIVTTSGQFTLYTLVNSEKGSINGPFYLSVAIMPDPGEIGPVLGSYDFDGDTKEVVGDMIYGTPPLDEYLISKGLPGHGVFDTYYREHSFNLDSAPTTAIYNSQDYPGGPNPAITSGPLYYRAFNINALGLASGYVLHFDLYTKIDGGIDKFAPFSHDVTHAPVPGALLLGLLGLSAAGMKLRKHA